MPYPDSVFGLGRRGSRYDFRNRSILSTTTDGLQATPPVYDKAVLELGRKILRGDREVEGNNGGDRRATFRMLLAVFFVTCVTA